MFEDPEPPEDHQRIHLAPPRPADFVDIPGDMRRAAGHIKHEPILAARIAAELDWLSNLDLDACWR